MQVKISEDVCKLNTVRVNYASSNRNMALNGNSTDLENGTDLKLPNWINADYFKEILVLDGKSKWRYITHEVKMASDKGENYASVLYRVKVNAENEENQIEELSYILKTNLVAKGPEKEMMDLFNAFGKETEMYESVVPNFQQLLENYGNFTKLSPKCIKTTTPEAEQILLEGLSEKKFKMASRHDGLDMDHIKLVIERLSIFHAASAVCEENNGPYSDLLLEGMFHEKLKKIYDSFYNTNLPILKETIGSMVNGKRYLKQMENYGEKCANFSAKLSKYNPNDFNVLNHGDLWINNLMFQYNEKDEVKDMIFIDLQMSVWGSPAIDLHYFLISSPKKHLKLKEFDAIVQFYHENLIKWLKQLGYKKHIPTLLELQVDLLQRGFLGFMASIIILPVVLLKQCENADMGNMLSEDDAGIKFKRQLYSNPEYADILEMLLEYFDKKGILEI